MTYTSMTDSELIGIINDAADLRSMEPLYGDGLR